jgi:hypothetical protein
MVNYIWLINEWDNRVGAAKTWSQNSGDFISHSGEREGVDLLLPLLEHSDVLSMYLYYAPIIMQKSCYQKCDQ